MSSNVGSKDVQCRSWLATISAEKMSRKEVEEALDAYSYLGQLEEGEGGFRHWQLLIVGAGRSPIRFSTLKRRLPTAHLEPRRGSMGQAIEYVTKTDTRVAGEPRLKHGEIRHSDSKGKRTDVDVVREAILNQGLSVDEVLLQVPQAARMPGMVEKLCAARDRDRHKEPRLNLECMWLYGPPGSGKTRTAVELGGDSYCRVTDYLHPFDAYSGERVLILDEFDGSLPLSLMLNVLDVWPMRLPARYWDRVAAYECVVVVSNDPPWGFYRFESLSRRLALKRRVHRVMVLDCEGLRSVEWPSVGSDWQGEGYSIAS